MIDVCVCVCVAVAVAVVVVVYMCSDMLWWFILLFILNCITMLFCNLHCIYIVNCTKVCMYKFLAQFQLLQQKIALPLTDSLLHMLAVCTSQMMYNCTAMLLWIADMKPFDVV